MQIEFNVKLLNVDTDKSLRNLYPGLHIMYQ